METPSELLQAQARIFRDVLAHIGSMSLKSAVQLGIFDAVHSHGRPITLSDLAATLSLPPSKSPYLHRLLLFLARKGYLARHRGREDEYAYTYSLTPSSQPLRVDSPTSLAPLLLNFLDHRLEAHFCRLGEFYRLDGPSPTAMEMENGKTIWELAGEDPEVNRLFNGAMAGDSQVTIKAVVTECRDAFRGLRTLVDVGGGNGASARAIAEAFPGVRCTVFDLPHVVATVPATAGVDAVGGDMFHSIPPADAVFLKMIMHVCNDENCIKILKLCKEAIPSRENGGKVMIVDIVLNDEDDRDPTTSEIQLTWDMLMLATVEGKERREHEWKKMFMDAGFTNYKITPLGVRSLIEVFP